MKHIMAYASQCWMKRVQIFLAFICLHSLAYATGNEESIKPIPKTIPAIWQAVDEQVTAINEAIANNQLDQIHRHAFTIADLVKSLPALSNALSEQQRTDLKKQIGYIVALAVRLDKTGDAKDKEGTQANFEKLQKVLSQIRAQYGDVLKSSK